MRTGKIMRRIAMLISLVMLITSTIGTTYCYIVTKTDPITNVFVPGTAGVSGLTISKTVEHPLGDGYAIPDNIRFDFNVELGSYYAGAKLNTTAGEMTADASGTLSVSIKPGVTFGIEGLEEGTVVKVTEQATTLKGFAVKGEATQQITVGADGSASIRFVNTYTPESVQPTNITVSGVKILEGREWQEGDGFSFKLEQQTGDSWTELGTKTVTYSADNADFNKFDFSDLIQSLTFDKVGIYTFRMSEIVGDIDVDYDKTVNHFTVKVTDVDMDGKLEISTVAGTENAKVTGENGNYTVSVTFNNTFVPPVIVDPDPITVQIDVNKVVTNTGNIKTGLDGFEFVLENVATSEKLSQISDENGKAAFALTFTKADAGNTYTYKLSETNQGFTGMTYDTDVYEIKISISLNDENQLVASITVDDAPVETVVAEFQNVYHADETVSPPIGDNSHVTFWFILMIVSGATLVSLIIYDRKRARV